MGYSASGGGHIQFTPEAKESLILKALIDHNCIDHNDPICFDSALQNAGFSSYDNLASDFGGLEIEIVYMNHCNWHGEAVEAFLEAIAPYVEDDCSITFVGDDGERWAYIFEDGKIRFELGNIVYGGRYVVLHTRNTPNQTGVCQVTQVFESERRALRQMSNMYNAIIDARRKNYNCSIHKEQIEPYSRLTVFANGEWEQFCLINIDESRDSSAS